MSLGLQRIEATGVEETVRLLDLPAVWLVVLVLLPLFAGLAWLGYARENLSRPMRATLFALRFAAFVLLGLVLARPVRVERRQEVHPASVLVLVDDSASMRRSDAYPDDGARKALEEAAGLAPGEASRLDLARAVYARTLAPLPTSAAWRAAAAPRTWATRSTRPWPRSGDAT